MPTKRPGSASPARTDTAGNGRGTGFSRGLLEEWHSGVRICHVGHTRAATAYERRARGLGLVTTILSTAVGTTLFATLSKSPSTTMQVILGGVALGATVAAAIHTFMAYGKLSEQHRVAANTYGRLRREMEEWVGEASPGDTPPKPLVHHWQLTWNEAEAGSPPIPDRIYDKVQARVEQTGGGAFMPRLTVTERPAGTTTPTVNGRRRRLETT